MLDFVRAFLGHDWEPDWLELDYPQPQDRKVYSSLIDSPLVFDQPHLGVPIRNARLRESSKIASLLPRPELGRLRETCGGAPAARSLR